ncbi:TIGR02530 family flagellar biosynthesis protein [Virgibacillus sp. YIM 98842]|uniref:TIGR02530 family flagellar biosynthesis protein n=1 Tax=Virgibacillus sp. YIM 98842 TaxID=2663533 RepID=UPI001F0891B6|nr:TIGR02530 family flagellar biosynthesis protein [Virgibacillus sp. YIM 98842]
MDHRIHQVPHQHALSFPKVQKPEKSKPVFKEILAKEQQELKISKHAEARLQARNISINEKQWKTIEQKMQEAKQKGITDSLVVMNEAALLVSTKNNTVITALDKDEAKSRIFTNINGTILINE